MANAMSSTRRRRRRPSAGASTFGARLNLMYLPALALLGVFLVYPLIRGIGISFTNWNGYSGASDMVGLANYTRLFTDANFRTSLVNTFIYGFGSTLIQQVLGLALALVLNGKIRGRGLARAVIYLPALVSPVVMGTMYYLLFSYNNGGLNDIVVAFGGERVAWLSDAGVGILVIVLVNSLQFVGISMVIYLAGLQAIPAMYHEAASLDGAGPRQRFWHITVPLLQPAFATSVVFNLIGGLKLFDVIKVMTNGGPGYSTNSVSTYISRTYFDSQSAGYASAQGVALFLLIAVFTMALNRFFARGEVEED